MAVSLISSNSNLIATTFPHYNEEIFADSNDLRFLPHPGSVEFRYVIERKALREKCTLMISHPPHIFYPQASEIFPNLYVSDQYTATSPQILDDLGITHMLSVKETVFPFGNRFRCLHIPLYDDEKEDLLRVLPTTTSFLKKGLRIRSQSRVLVHCALGRSRSVSVVIGYLIACHFMSYDAALAHMKARRPISGPNHGFEKQLREWERMVRSDREKALELGLARCRT